VDGTTSHGFESSKAVPDLLTITREGLFCPRGGFHIDPWRSVERALITHGHSDHARAGSASYLTAQPGVPILRSRLGDQLRVTGVGYGERVSVNGVNVSFHPAGHVLGSAQIRVESKGEVWVVSGDYKLENDGISGAFEPVSCNVFITECTFGLPIYRWEPQREVIAGIDQWWRTNQEQGRASVIYTYALGKAQRLLNALDPSIGPIFVHAAVEKLITAYEMAGIQFPARANQSGKPDRDLALRSLVITPPAAADTPWLRKFGPCSTAFASGWMRVRGRRRRDNLGQGFVLSDHADWPGLLDAIESTNAERILLTHGYTAQMERYLKGIGYDAAVLPETV